VYKSALKTHTPAVVAGTEADYPGCIDISDDGRWAVYTSGHLDTRNRYVLDTAYLVGLETGVKTGIPVFLTRGYNQRTGDSTDVHPAAVSFYHQSPKGTEICYYGYNWRGDAAIHAVSVDLSGAAPVFGASRPILNLDTNQTNRRIWPYGGTIATVAARDAIFGAFASFVGFNLDVVYNEYITIPDGGNGVAGVADMYQWQSVPDTSLWGCGESMSHDATLCVTNSGYIGSACVPNKNQEPQMDHKGFYITPFFRAGTTPSMDIQKQIDSAGVSINWCPQQYRIGS